MNVNIRNNQNCVLKLIELTELSRVDLSRVTMSGYLELRKKGRKK